MEDLLKKLDGLIRALKGNDIEGTRKLAIELTEKKIAQIQRKINLINTEMPEYKGRIPQLEEELKELKEQLKTLNGGFNG